MEEQISKVLMDFLDTDSYEEKYQILVATPTSDFSDLIIDNMASSIDAVIPDGHLDNRIQDLKIYVRTRAKYETTRLR